MPEQVTFEKVKSNGSEVKMQVPVLRDGDWKEWLEWLLRLSEYFMFMGYSQNDADQLDFVEDVQVLLHDDDLLLFNETVAEEQYVSNNVAIQALRRLTAVHCPPGTRALIMDQLIQTKKTRTMTVQADLVRMFKSAMPVDWQLQLNRHARTWDLTSMEAQFEAIERN
ncbi:hypothetical protein PF011_g5690 [Phytophthora fragariae]|uniref:Uncharacterized protein n=1 Tax=Phytophthora fragariae TaxID=53985 RepID=A0A6A3LKR2_9STRA|nr:hypothetical protein PF011_g5690 [Phytophthora fragariae]